MNVALLVLQAATTVSLNLDPALSCPAMGTLADRFQRVGLSLVPLNPPIDQRLSPPAFEVSIKPTGPAALLVTARRAKDGKVFERTLEPGREDCPTVERLVVVLIHSWINTKMPVLSPRRADAGTKR
jgi:hypothetical protein